MGPVDRGILHAINGGPEALAPAMRFLSEATSYGWFKLSLLILVVAMVAASPRTRRTAIQALFAVALADTITNVLKHALPMHRPFQVEHVILRLGETDSMGTASAHSANMAAVAFVFTYYLGWWGSPWVAIAFLTGWSRIYNGVHYPSQVVLGWLCGLFAALVVTKTWEALLRVRKPVVMEENSDGVESA